MLLKSTKKVVREEQKREGRKRWRERERGREGSNEAVKYGMDARLPQGA